MPNIKLNSRATYTKFLPKLLVFLFNSITLMSCVKLNYSLANIITN